jgi:hypothetical protein
MLLKLGIKLSSCAPTACRVKAILPSTMQYVDIRMDHREIGCDWTELAQDMIS